jgi:hypothetical protein
MVTKAASRSSAPRTMHPAEGPPAPGVYVERAPHSTIVVSVGKRYVTHIPVGVGALGLVRTSVERFTGLYCAANEDQHGVAAKALTSAEPTTAQAQAVLRAVAAVRGQRSTAAPPRRMTKPWGFTGRVLKPGKVPVEQVVRPGTLRAALMETITAHVGEPAESVLGTEVLPGKPRLAKVDVEFAVQHGFVTV